MSSIRGMQQEDILSWGMLTMMIAKAVPPGDCIIYQEDGYYTRHIDVKIEGRWLRLTVSTEHDDLASGDAFTDLQRLLEELA